MAKKDIEAIWARLKFEELAKTDPLPGKVWGVSMFAGVSAERMHDARRDTEAMSDKDKRRTLARLDRVFPRSDGARR